MSAIYQGCCKKCGYATPMVTDGYGAVWVDQPATTEQHEVAGAVLYTQVEAPFATATDSRFVALAHPIEAECLASTGYTWRDLLWQGRYVRVENVICRECSTVFQVRTLTAPGFSGCVSAVVCGVAAGLTFGIWWRSVLLGSIVWWLTTVAVISVTELLERLYVRCRFASRAAALIEERFCPKCNANDFTSIHRATSIRCPACLNDALTFEMVGIS
jgi:hypothetical protein